MRFAVRDNKRAFNGLSIIRVFAECGIPGFADRTPV